MVKELLIFGAGFVAGAFASVALLKKKLDERYDAEIADSKAYYDEKVRELDDKSESGLNEAKMGLKQPNLDDDIPDIPKNEEKSYDKNKIIEKLNYGAMFKGTQEDIKEKPKEEDVVMKHGETGGPEPEIISDDEYYSNDAYEKRTVTYYSESENFISAMGEPILYENMIKLIGHEDYLEHFGDYETDTLFIRNHDKMTDYEIILEEKEYDGE